MRGAVNLSSSLAHTKVRLLCVSNASPRGVESSLRTRYGRFGRERDFIQSHSRVPRSSCIKRANHLLFTQKIGDLARDRLSPRNSGTSFIGRVGTWYRFIDVLACDVVNLTIGEGGTPILACIKGGSLRTFVSKLTQAQKIRHKFRKLDSSSTLSKPIAPKSFAKPLSRW